MWLKEEIKDQFSPKRIYSKQHFGRNFLRFLLQIKQMFICFLKFKDNGIKRQKLE